MAYSLIFDDATLVLTLTIILLLSLTIYIGKGYQPLVHPLILSRQADVSPIRYKGQSAIYRNASSPAGLDVALKPRRKVNRVLDVLQYGSESVEASLTRERSFYGLQKSNQNILDSAKAFAIGICNIAGLSSTSELGIAICVDSDTLHSFLVSISGSVHQSKNKAFSPLVIPPSLVKNGQAPSSLPSAYPAKQIHAVFTTPAALQVALKLPSVNESTIIVVTTEDEAQSARDITPNRLISFDKVLAQSAKSTLASTEELDLAEAGQDPAQLIYWTGKAAWIPITNESLIAAITAYLACFSSQSQPSENDHIHVTIAINESDQHQGTSSPHLSAAFHPAGLVFPLLALYTGAGFSISSLTAAASSNSFSEVKPTLLFTSPLGASTLATALCNVSSRSMLVRPAFRGKMAYLRSGTFSQGGLWDSLVFSKSRSSLLCQDLRSMLILGEGNSISQDLLDILRAQLGCAVRQAYLPRSSLPSLGLELGLELTAGIGEEALASSSHSALVTAPLTAVHSLDLQAFAEDTGLAPAHHGAPTVAIEMKLVETNLAKSLRLSVEGPSFEKDQGHAKDPSGEIFVRGHTLTGVDNAKQWCATGDIGSIRSNGTLVILKSHLKTSPVHVPSLPVNAKKRMRSGHASSTFSILTLLFCCFLCFDTVQAGLLEGSQIPRLPPSSPDLYKRTNGINTTMVDTAIMGFMTAPRSSWEQGCSQSALLEYSAAQWSVFSNQKGGPLYESSQASSSNNFPQQLLSGAYSNLRTQDSVGKLCSYVTGDENVGQGSALDSASCGEAVLLAGASMGDIGNGQILNSNGQWIRAAQEQLNYILTTVLRGPSGIISMRSSDLAYWSDALYMMPPFLALYGLLTSNQTLLQESYNQISLYIDQLVIPSGPARGLLRHIVNGTGTSGNDSGAWLTGNGWAAAGMVKVIATISQSPYASQMQPEINQLITWTQDILDGCYSFANPLIPNYVNDTTTFRDAAGSALVAYSTYRLSSLSPTNNSAHLDAADAVYSTLQNSLTPFATFTSSVDVVDALTFTQSAQMSPESLAFLVLLSSAKRDHQMGNVTGINGANTGYAGSASLSSSHLRASTACFLFATGLSAMLALFAF